MSYEYSIVLTTGEEVVFDENNHAFWMWPYGEGRYGATKDYEQVCELLRKYGKKTGVHITEKFGYTETSKRFIPGFQIKEINRRAF